MYTMRLQVVQQARLLLITLSFRQVLFVEHQLGHGATRVFCVIAYSSRPITKQAFLAELERVAGCAARFFGWFYLSLSAVTSFRFRTYHKNLNTPTSPYIARLLCSGYTLYSRNSVSPTGTKGHPCPHYSAARVLVFALDISKRATT